jgi:hypothetical protein
MEYSENISAVFRELVLFLRAGTLRGDMSPTENVPGENTSPAWCFGKIPDPKTGVPFPLTMLYP